VHPLDSEISPSHRTASKNGLLRHGLLGLVVFGFKAVKNFLLKLISTHSGRTIGTTKSLLTKCIRLTQKSLPPIVQPHTTAASKNGLLRHGLLGSVVFGFKAVGDGGSGAMVPPYVGRSAIPILTRGVCYAHQIATCPYPLDFLTFLRPWGWVCSSKTSFIVALKPVIPTL
jgi:hypothetical protein